MMKMRIRVWVAVLSLMVCLRSSAEEKSPDEVMTARGLTRVGAVYALEVDAQLPERLRALRLAQKQKDDAAKKRGEIGGDLKAADTVTTLQEREYRDLVQKLDKSTDAVQRARLANQVKAMEASMRDAARAKGDREKDLSKMADPRAAYVNLLLDLADKTEAAVKQYETLSNDANVKKAIAQLSEKIKLKLRLGPSPQFVQELPGIRKQRAEINTTVIPLIAGKDTPHINAMLAGTNGSLTRAVRVDPDAANLLLTANTAWDLGVAPAPGDKKVHLFSADGKVSEVSLMQLKSVRLGAFTLQNVPCAVQPGSFKNAENVLGGPVLEYFTGRLDPTRAELRLSQMVPKAGAAKPDGGLEITFKGTDVADPELSPPDPAGKILLICSNKDDRETAMAACQKYNLTYEVTDNFNAATEDYHAYRAILVGSNHMDYWGREENKPVEAFTHVNDYVESGGHLVIFGTFNARNCEHLKRYGILCSYYHGDYFAAVPGLTDQLMLGNEELLPTDNMLHTAGNFKCTSPHVILLARTKKSGEDDGPLMITMPWKKGRITFNVVEPNWKQPHDGLWLLTATLGWVSRGSPMEPLPVTDRPTTRKVATSKPVESPSSPTVSGKSVPETKPGESRKPNIFTDPSGKK